MKKLLCVFTVLCLSCAAFGAETWENLYEKGKAAFVKKEYDAAEEVLQKAHALAPQNADILLSLAGISFIKQDYKTAEQQFGGALKLLPKDSPFTAYTYSRMGDSAIKQNKIKEASDYFDKALSYSKNDVNSLIGKGVVYELNKKPEDAALMYKRAFNADPYNIIARDKSREFEIYLMSDEEILDALKSRNAVPPETTVLSDENRRLYEHIHEAEVGGAVDYLIEKQKNLPKDYIITKDSGLPTMRIMLSIKAFNLFQKLIAQDAYNDFLAAKVSVNDIPKLRNLQGKAVFDTQGLLTKEGKVVHAHLKQGQKTFILPTDDIPLTKAELAGLEARMKEVESRGYMYILNSEYSALKESTYCSDETLEKTMGVYAMRLGKKTVRYFVMVPALRHLSEKDPRAIPFNVVNNKRKAAHGIAPDKKTKTYRNFFGRGGMDGMRVCDDEGNYSLYGYFE